MQFCTLILVTLSAAVALAGPLQQVRRSADGDVQILRSESEVLPESFKYAYETSDGQSAQAQGQLLNIGSENESIAIKGSFQFVGDDGQTYLVTYIADENGFQPSGAHLPVAPEA